MDGNLHQSGKLVLERVALDDTFSESGFKFFIYLFLYAVDILIKNETRRKETILAVHWTPGYIIEKGNDTLPA